MRAPGNRRTRFAKRNKAEDTSLSEIKLRDCGSVPERDVASPAIGRDNRRIRKGRWNALERRKIKALNDFAVAGIQEQRCIGIVTRNKQALLAAAHTDA